MYFGITFNLAACLYQPTVLFVLCKSKLVFTNPKAVAIQRRETKKTKLIRTRFAFREPISVTRGWINKIIFQ